MVFDPARKAYRYTLLDINSKLPLCSKRSELMNRFLFAHEDQTNQASSMTEFVNFIFNHKNTIAPSETQDYESEDDSISPYGKVRFLTKLTMCL